MSILKGHQKCVLHILLPIPNVTNFNLPSAPPPTNSSVQNYSQPVVIVSGDNRTNCASVSLYIYLFLLIAIVVAFVFILLPCHVYIVRPRKYSMDSSGEENDDYDSDIEANRKASL